MTKIVNSDFKSIDIELLLQDLTSVQTETLLGGCCQILQGDLRAYIVNISDSVTLPMNKPESKTETENKNPNDIRNKKINTIDNSRRNYLNDMLIKGKRSIIVI